MEKMTIWIPLNHADIAIFIVEMIRRGNRDICRATVIEFMRSHLTSWGMNASGIIESETLSDEKFDIESARSAAGTLVKTLFPDFE